jgi:hypothetical protein
MVGLYQILGFDKESEYRLISKMLFAFNDITFYFVAFPIFSQFIHFLDKNLVSKINI